MTKSYNMKCFLSLIFSVCCWQVAIAQNQALDSLFSLYHRHTEGVVEKVRLLNEIAWEFNVVDIDSTQYYADLALTLAKKRKYFHEQARALNLIAIYHSYKNKIDSSILLNEQALALSLKHDFRRYRSFIYNDLAINYGQIGDYEKSLAYYYKALAVSEEEDQFNIYTIVNIAKTHEQLGNEERAKHFYEQSNQLANLTVNKQLLHFSLTEKGFFFSREGQLDSALIYLKKAHEVSLVENMKLNANDDLLNIASLYIEMEQYDSCISTLQSLAKIKIKGGRNIEIPYNGMLSYAYKNKAEYDEALKYRLICKTEAEKAGLINMMPHIYKELSELYVANNDFENAYHNYFAYQTLQDSIVSVEKEKAFLELDSKYQIQRKEERNQELKKANVLLTVAAIFFVLFALVSTLLLVMRNRSTKILQTKNQELQILNRELTIAKKKALEASATKQNFLSRMSHEIRTPLNAIIGFVNILIHEKPSLNQLPYLHHLKSSGKYLIYLINNLLDLSRLEAGKLELEDQAFNLKQLLEETIDSFRLINTNEKVEIALDYQVKALNQMLIGSGFRLNQIIYNLMSNALKFTQKGKVVLRATLLQLEESEECAQIRFEVEDTGVGIPQDKQRKIFESFTQADSSIAQDFGGSGLGLSIVKDLLELLDSEIQVVSEENKGSNFSFVLEFKLGENIYTKSESSASIQPRVVEAEFTGLKVLIAEDNLFNQKIAVKILENKGMITTSSSNGKEALEAFKAQKFDLILMDLHMPLMDGEEAVKHIRKLEDHQERTPIIILSATTLDPFASGVHAMDVEYYIEKPFSPEVLFEAIGNCLNLSESAAV